MKAFAATVSATFMLWAGAGSAAEPPARAEAFQALTRCRAIADPAERFACLERSAAALEEAADRGDVVIVDRQQIRSTKKTLFGLAIPRLDIFSGPGEEEIEQVDGTIAGASRDGDGRWLVRLESGARWQQIDGRVLPLSPKAGDTVTIKRATMGSFMLQIRGRAGFRVKRLD
jgi:hypothetical protein